MPSAIAAFADHTFRALKIHRLYATPFSFNHASHRALEKAGFEREGLMKHYHKKGNDLIDAIMFAKVSQSGHHEHKSITITPAPDR